MDFYCMPCKLLLMDRMRLPWSLLDAGQFFFPRSPSSLPVPPLFSPISLESSPLYLSGPAEDRIVLSSRGIELGKNIPFSAGFGSLLRVSVGKTLFSLH